MYGVTPLQRPVKTKPPTGLFGTPLSNKPEGYYEEQQKNLPPMLPQIMTPRELLAPVDERGIVFEDQINPIVGTSISTPIAVDVSETLPTNVDMLQPRIDRITPSIQQQFEGATFDPRSKETSDILDGKGAGAFGFTESRDEVLRLYEGIHGEGRVRVFEDRDAGIFEPSFYVSLEKDDGSFTPFASPLQDTYDITKAIASNLAYEVPAGSASAATAWAAAGTATALFSPIPLVAPVIGALTFMYTLYAMGGSGEKFKQEVLKDELGLTDKDADETGTVVERAYDTYNKGVTPPFAGGEEFKSGERMAGGAELLLGVPGALMDKFRMSMGRLRRKYLAQAEGGESPSNVYQSAVSAQEFAQREGLPGFTLAQVKDNRIIERLDSLAQQTSVIIPTRIREQMEGAVAYLRKHSDDLGEGDFAKFQDTVDGIADEYAALKDRIGTPDYKRAGTSIQEIDKIFRQLRFYEAQGLYANVFDTIGKKSYDLSNIDATITKRTRPVIPEKVGDAPYDATQMRLGRGEVNVYDTIDVLKTLGTSKDGTLTVTDAGLRQAIKKFNEVNPGYPIDRADPSYSVDSPAKLLQMFATRFGEMGRDLRNIPENQQTNAIRNARTTAMEMRDALLDAIANPQGVDDAVKAQIKRDLKEANDFYKETYDIVEKAGVKVKTSAGGPAATEPSALAKEILEKSRNDAQEDLLAALNKQRDYIKNKIPTANPEELNILSKEFDNQIQIKLAQTMGGEAAEESGDTAVATFLSNFGKDEREALGYPPERVAEVMKEASMLAEMASENWATISMKRAVPSTPLLKVFSRAFDADDTNSALGKMIQTAKRDTAGTGMENLRNGLFDYLVSTESGVLKPITKNTATKRVGTPGNPNYEIDATRLTDILVKMKESQPELRKILTDRDLEVLEGISTYVNTISKAEADAGAALAGAQIIGELFTVDGTKFLSGLARLGAQKRISKIFTNDFFVNSAVGLGQSVKAGNFTDTIRTYFFGKGAMGAIIADMAYDPPTQEEQMREAFSGKRVDEPLGMYGPN